MYADQFSFDPQTREQAIPVVASLTHICERAAREVPGCKDRRRVNVMIARFRELNEVRVRIIEQFGLQDFAAAVVAGS